jgi:hypothetical protein
VIPGWVKIKIERITELPESMYQNIFTVFRRFKFGMELFLVTDCVA